MKVPSAVQLPAAERGRAGAARGRHRVRDGEVRRRLVRRLVPALRLLRHLPRQLRGALVRSACPELPRAARPGRLLGTRLAVAAHQEAIAQHRRPHPRRHRAGEHWCLRHRTPTTGLRVEEKDEPKISLSFFFLFLFFTRPSSLPVYVCTCAMYTRQRGVGVRGLDGDGSSRANDAFCILLTLVFWCF